jgi:hypothetical protein
MNWDNHVCFLASWIYLYLLQRLYIFSPTNCQEIGQQSFVKKEPLSWTLDLIATNSCAVRIVVLLCSATTPLSDWFWE